MNAIPRTDYRIGSAGPVCNDGMQAREQSLFDSPSDNLNAILRPTTRAQTTSGDHPSPGFDHPSCVCAR